jgi:preprotein translocase subunit SecA
LRKQILAQQKETNLLSDEELKSKITILRKKITKEKNLDKYLVSVFVLVREVVHRKTGL